ncbi:hypothetical protein RIF29_05578 [Crotalaria pallida]|uniref:Uncharacterized protein n=1 Tax=Crotalaria pallida TaxID=3830 RepID=A0AAN9J267_CROPI
MAAEASKSYKRTLLELYGDDDDGPVTSKARKISNVTKDEEFNRENEECVMELSGKEVWIDMVGGLLRESEQVLRKIKEDFDGRQILLGAQAKEPDLHKRKSLQLLHEKMYRFAEELLEKKEKQHEGRLKELRTKEEELDARQKLMDGQAKEEELKRKSSFNFMQKIVYQYSLERKKKEKQHEEKMKELESMKKRVMELESKEKQLERLVKELESKGKEFEGQVKELESKKNHFEGHVKVYESKGEQFEERIKELESKDKQFEERLNELRTIEEELESKRKHFDGQVKEFESKEEQFEERIKELELKDEQFEERLKELRTIEDSYCFNGESIEKGLIPEENMDKAVEACNKVIQGNQPEGYVQSNDPVQKGGTVMEQGSDSIQNTVKGHKV